MAEILHSLDGRRVGLDVAGNLVLNKPNGTQVVFTAPGAAVFGPYATSAALQTANPAASTAVGTHASVGSAAPYADYVNNGTAWVLGGGSTTLVNDLTTGGTAAALTAEQGKTLKTGQDSNAAAIAALSAASGSLRYPVAAGTAFPLDKDYSAMASQIVSADTTFTIATSPALVAGGNAVVVLVGDNSHVATMPTSVVVSGNTIPVLNMDSYTYDSSKINRYGFVYDYGVIEMYGASIGDAVALPSAPAGLTIGAIGGTSVGLSWTAVSGVTDYVVYYQPGQTGPYLVFADGVSTGTSTTVTGLTGSTAYNFGVAGKNAGGIGPMSTPAAATTVADAGGTLLESDAFTRSDVTPLDNGWVQTSGFGYFQLVSNAVRGFGSDSATNRPGTQPDDQYAEVTLKGSNVENSGPAVRLRTSGTKHGYMARYYAAGSVIVLSKWTNGTLTYQLSTVAATPVAGDVLRLSVKTISGNAELKIFLNGALIKTYTDSASPILSGNYGMCSHGNLIDAWAGGTP